MLLGWKIMGAESLAHALVQTRVLKEILAELKEINNNLRR